jgi:hypothetical protein
MNDDGTITITKGGIAGMPTAAPPQFLNVEVDKIKGFE